MIDRQKWVLKHPEYENLVWGTGDDFMNDYVGWTDVTGKASIIESKYKPTYLNFIGSNSHAKEMKKGVVCQL